MTPDEQTFHIARSQLLDAFARLECAVIGFINVNGGEIGCPTKPLGQKLELLAKLKAGPRLSKARKSEIETAVRQFAPHLSVRADIVHGLLNVLSLDEKVAVYRNATEAGAQYPSARMLTLDQHRKLSREAEKLAAELVEKS
jgi:hypothetical protein